jgi:TDG/mug DNA glycosylase family protein
MRLPPRLCARPRILFVGINPSLESARVGHHFAGPGNPFYRLLHAAGLVREPMTFADDVRLPGLGLALTNIAERATREAAELTATDYVQGRRRLARTIARTRPAVVAFVGVTAYRRFFGPSASGGAGPKPERVAGAAVFVVPNPSGRNAAYPGFHDKLVWYRRLARWGEQSAAQCVEPQMNTPGCMKLRPQRKPRSVTRSSPAEATVSPSKSNRTFSSGRVTHGTGKTMR